MKKITIRLVTVVLAVITAATALPGCSKDPVNAYESPHFLYVPEVTQLCLPEGMEWIDNITVSGDLLYFTAMANESENDLIQTYEIFCMDLIDSDLRELPNYTVETEYPANTEGGSVQIYSMCIDSGGDIWVAECGEYYLYDLPDDFDGEDWEKWNHRTILDSFNRIRKLDNTGAQVQSFDIGRIAAGQEWFYIYAFAVDDDNNIYIGTESKVHVLDSEGGTQFTLDINFVDAFVEMYDGTIALTDWRENGRVLAKIDVAGRKWGESIDLPNNANTVYTGNDEYSFIYTGDTGLHGVESATGEAAMLLNWIDSDMTIDGLVSITLLTDGRILVIRQHWNDDGSRYELAILTKTSYSELPDKAILTLATFYLDQDIRSAIVQFNRTSATHHIQVTDYADFSTDDDWQAGLSRLSAEIIAGSVPDILDVSNLPGSQYAAMGLLADIYPMIDSDPKLSRSDFMESVLRATEIDGGLYHVFPSFSIGTIMGNPAVVGGNPGWDMNEFLAVLDANPNADMPLGQGFTKLSFLQAMFMFHINEFVDWTAGKVNFDSDEFSSLLEFAGTFPDNYDWNSEYIEEHELISAGRQIMAATGFSNFNDYRAYRAIFGGDVVFKGFPTGSGSGNSLLIQTSFAITNACKDIDGAWAFLSTLLNEDWQRENTVFSIPINKAIFESKLTEAMTEDEYGSHSMSIDGFMVELQPLTQAQADQIMALIDSVSGSAGHDEALWNIVSEDASDFFNGQASLQDTIRVIQNRASIYISEQSG